MTEHACVHLTHARTHTHTLSLSEPLPETLVICKSYVNLSLRRDFFFFHFSF